MAYWDWINVLFPDIQTEPTSKPHFKKHNIPLYIPNLPLFNYVAGVVPEFWFFQLISAYLLLEFQAKPIHWLVTHN